MKHYKPINCQDLVLTAIFCAFLSIFYLLFFLLPKQAASETERRTLQTQPQLSSQTLFSGQFTSDIEKYIADQFPGRTLFVGMNAYFEQATGRNGVSGIYAGKDGNLFTAPTQRNPQNFSTNCDALTSFAQKTQMRAFAIAVPAAGYILPDKLPAVHDFYPDAALLTEIQSALSPTFQVVDVAGAFAQHSQAGKQLYYKTDHHWTSLGAYTAYCQLAEAMGFAPLSRDAFQVETIGGFYGTSYAKSGLWLTPPDTLELWHTADLDAATVEIYDDATQTTHSLQGIFSRSYLDTADKYSVFLDSNHSLVKVTNPSAPEGKLLVVKDSYANCLTPFLAAHYREITLVDLRYYRTFSASEYAEQQNIQDLLVVYSVENMVNDTDMLWLN